MANLNIWSKTSYFQVKDREAFLKEIKEVNTEDLRVEEKDGKFILFGGHFMYVSRDIYNLDGDIIDEVEESMVSILQKHMIQEEKIIVTAAGQEGYRYIGGDAWIITRTDFVYISLEQAIRKAAVEKGIITEEESFELTTDD
ncbi:hypothetical protein [Psychrobacillus sp. FSL H8-0510]|uniref:hypothetical protein n=1 Tax=Psychrobacillus sp. FSL H8-0510 TaxID=2921394 RepID=UPI0030F783BE